MPDRISLDKEPNGKSLSLTAKSDETELKELRDLGFSALRTKHYWQARNHFRRLSELDKDDFFANLGFAIIYAYDCRVESNTKRQKQKGVTCTKQWNKLISLIPELTETNRELIKEYCTGVTVGFDMDVFTFAVLSYYPEMVNVFLQSGFDPCTEYDGRSILHYIVNGSELQYTKSCAIINLLLDYGADPNVLTGDGEGILNSRTPQRYADIVRERYPHLKSKDMNPIKKLFNRYSQSDKEALGCSLVILLIIVALWLSSILPKSHNDSSILADYTGAGPAEGDYIECRGCDNYTYYTRWNRGYCSECHQGTHTCAGEGCTVEIPDSSWIEYCVLHDD